MIYDSSFGVHFSQKYLRFGTIEVFLGLESGAPPPYLVCTVSVSVCEDNGIHLYKSTDVNNSDVDFSLDLSQEQIYEKSSEDVSE